MSAWDLYDELIDAIPLDIQVVKAAQPGVRVRIRFNGRLSDAIVLERRNDSEFAGELRYLDQGAYLWGAWYQDQNSSKFAASALPPSGSHVTNARYSPWYQAPQR